jgi:hypothetical protein
VCKILKHDFRDVYANYGCEVRGVCDDFMISRSIGPGFSIGGQARRWLTTTNSLPYGEYILHVRDTQDKLELMAMEGSAFEVIPPITTTFVIFERSENLYPYLTKAGLLY